MSPDIPDDSPALWPVGVTDEQVDEFLRRTTEVAEMLVATYRMTHPEHEAIMSNPAAQTMMTNGIVIGATAAVSALNQRGALPHGLEGTR